MNLFLFGLTKTETGAKTAPWVPKLSSRNVGGRRGLSIMHKQGITYTQTNGHY